MTVLNLHPIVIDDGEDWVACSSDEAQRLVNEHLITPCPDSCPKGTFHAIPTFAEVERRLEEIRRFES